MSDWDGGTSMLGRWIWNETDKDGKPVDRSVITEDWVNGNLSVALAHGYVHEHPDDVAAAQETDRRYAEMAEEASKIEPLNLDDN
jgi:hypothetical protein